MSLHRGSADPEIAEQGSVGVERGPSNAGRVNKSKKRGTQEGSSLFPESMDVTSYHRYSTSRTRREASWRCPTFPNAMMHWLLGWRRRRAEVVLFRV